MIAEAFAGSIPERDTEEVFGWCWSTGCWQTSPAQAWRNWARPCSLKFGLILFSSNIGKYNLYIIIYIYIDLLYDISVIRWYLYIYMGCWSTLLYPEMDIFAQKHIFAIFRQNQAFFFAKIRHFFSRNLCCSFRHCGFNKLQGKMWSSWDVNHTAVLKLRRRAQGCDQTGMSSPTTWSNWNVKRQDVVKQKKRTRNWNPICRQGYHNYSIIPISSSRDYNLCQESSYLVALLSREIVWFAAPSPARGERTEERGEEAKGERREARGERSEARGGRERGRKRGEEFNVNLLLCLLLVFIVFSICFQCEDEMSTQKT